MNPTARPYRHYLALVFGCIVAMLSCADQNQTAPGPVTNPDGVVKDGGVVPPALPMIITRPSPCVDEDGDGYGTACDRGPDCDDQASNVTDECRRCLRPSFGCPCAEDAPPVACNLDTGTTEASPEGVCRLGQRVCRGGTWSACERLEDSHARFIGAASSCYGSCDPSCYHVVDCPESTDPAPTSPLAISTLPPAVFCPSGVTPGGLQPRCEPRPGGPYLRAVSPATWVDACAAAGSTRVMAGVDDGVAAVPLPFAFSFWGVPYRSVNVSTNGMMQFGSSSTQWSNSILPSVGTPNAIFPFWDDLMMRNGVCVATVGTATNRRTVVQWSDAHFCCTNDPAVHLDFEVILGERDQTIDALYRTMQSADDRATGSSATVGVQEGSGTRFDLVSFDTARAIPAGTQFRWSPQSNDQSCTAGGVHRRVYAASCPAAQSPMMPVWGRMNFTSRVPPGAAIRLEVRAARTAADLASATFIRLPDAPQTNEVNPVTSSYDIGDILQSSMRGLAHMPFIELRASFDVGVDANLAPALGGVEVQYNCVPIEEPLRCVPGGACQAPGVCRRGVITCPTTSGPVCSDAGPLPAGTSCGAGSVCNAAGSCVACNEGAACDTGNVCQYGKISCATGAPVCVPVAWRPGGSVCVFGSGNYIREASPLGFINACALQGATVYLPAQTDSTTTATLPFAFRFYDTPYTQVGIGVNGFMGFPTAVSAWWNTSLPAAGAGNAVMPFWDDLQTRPAGICVGVLGRAPERLFVAQWANVDLENRGSSGYLGASLNFEVVLEESAQAINVLYGDMVGDARATGSSATVGIQNAAGTRFDQVSHNTTNSVSSNSAIRWRPPVSSACDGAGTCSVCLSSELCDGRDNTCNGLVDEGIPNVTCGVGACQRTVEACVQGVTQACVPGAPSVDLCDDIDNDCNGIVDDGCDQGLTCPGRITVHAGTAQVMSVVPRGWLTGYRWEIITGPPGAQGGLAWEDPPPRNPTTRAIPHIVGTYRIRVTARDRNGALQACDFELVVLSHGLRVELTWDGEGDVDLHMHNSSNTRWFSSDDCYYANMRSSFGARLDVDNIVADGPENIRIDAPPAGSSYTIAVHNYARAAGRVARVRVFCGTTAGTTPNAEYFSSPLAGSDRGNCTDNTFWRIARLTMRTDGSCDILPINNYIDAEVACWAF